MKGENLILFGVLTMLLLCGTAGLSFAEREASACWPAEASEAWAALEENFRTLPVIVRQDT